MRMQFLAAHAFPFPASRGAIRPRFHGFDFFWALCTPILALYVSEAYVIYTSNGFRTVALYSIVTFVVSVIALLIFRVQDGVERYFSVHDAIAVGKAVVVSEFVSYVVLFSATRLEGVPRSAPILHALLFGAGLLIYRAFIRVTNDDQRYVNAARGRREHIIVIGANDVSSLYIKMLQTCASKTHDVIAVLDQRQTLFGRSIEGVSIVGAPQHFESIISEYAVHGLEIDRLMIAGDGEGLTPAAMSELKRVCDRRRIALDIMPRLLGLQENPAPAKMDRPLCRRNVSIRPGGYFRVKRALDFCIAGILLVMLLPALIGVALLVMADSGLPILFWQQRLGQNGSRFLLYKFRTLRPPFDWKGVPIPPEKRLAKMGIILRELSLDELPQLLNVLVGDMSLIGPRPLLPEDQPADPSVRLSVRPGITGWAQIHGGKLLTPAEKDLLDEWYVKHASFIVDCQILIRTAEILLFRTRSSEASADQKEITSRKAAQVNDVSAAPDRKPTE
jgi:lipopolysaccharide/colanic/teichoic acid biosynthesis glycosyltransferase